VERVLGIGGVFLRARDGSALRRWYADNLGIELADWGGCVFEAEEGDVTVWSVFPADTDYFGPRDRQAMVNYRVRDLEAMLRQLRSAGAAVIDDIQVEENGRFGWVTDPEGNRIELWEPRPAE
jgi:predicted enzyme related to lactoylglutathione lyase